MPMFHGNDTYTWVDRVERFFEIRGALEEEWVSVAMMAMEGKAMTWFMWWEEITAVQTWSIFKEVIIHHFQPELVQNPFEILLGVRQEGSVKEFREIFEMYSRPLKIMERRYLLGLFLNGLKDEVRKGVLGALVDCYLLLGFKLQR